MAKAKSPAVPRRRPPQEFRIMPRKRDRRLWVIEQMIVRGWSHHDIQIHISQAWGMTMRGVRHYILAVYQRWEADAKQDPRCDRELVRLQFLEQHRAAMDKGAIGDATRASDRLARLGGLYAPLRVQVEQHQGPIDVDEARREIIELAAKHKIALPASTALVGGNGVGTNGAGK